MKKMTFDEYDKKVSLYETKAPSIHYGLSAQDIERMKASPDEYVDFAIYLSVQKMLKDDTIFYNQDALPKEEINSFLRHFLIDNLELV